MRATTTAVGVFTDRDCARQAVEELKRAGFRDEQIGVITPHDGAPVVSTDDGTERQLNVAEGAGLGLAAGAGVGTLWALGVAASVIPPLGVVAGGTLLAVLASASAGAAVIGLVGGLMGMGVPEDEARDYADEVKAGRTLVTVDACGPGSAAPAILQRYSGYDKARRTDTPVGAGV